MKIKVSYGCALTVINLRIPFNLQLTQIETKITRNGCIVVYFVSPKVFERYPQTLKFLAGSSCIYELYVEAYRGPHDKMS